MKKSEYGMILAATGNAIGLSNVWQFPYMVAENGGGSFIVVYIILAIIIGTFVLSAEFLLGQKLEDHDPIEAYARYEENTLMKYTAIGISFASMSLLFSYPLILSWVVDYLAMSITDSLPSSMEASKNIFTNIVSDRKSPIFIFYAIIALGGFVALLGVKKGMIRVSIVLIPILFLIFIGLVLYASNLNGFPKAIEVLFSFDWSKINEGIIFKICEEIFYSLSVGTATMIVISIIMGDEEINLVKSSLYIVLLDTLFAILAAIFIYTIIFTSGYDANAGENLIFVDVPNILSMQNYGPFIGVLFFLGIFIAGFTTIIPVFEVAIATFKYFHIDRANAVFLISALSVIFGTFSFLSLDIDYGKTFQIGEKSFFDFMDADIGVFAPIVGAFFVSISVGWIMEKEEVADLIYKFIKNDTLFELWYKWIKYVLPLVIGCLIYKNGNYSIDLFASLN